MQQSTQQPQSARFFCRRGALLAAVLSILSCTTPEEKDTLIGTFTMFNRESPYLIAAPYGEFDENTGELVYDFCEKVRWDCLIAEGFREDGARINVNRPTEGLRLSEAQFTERASLVYAKYLNRIRRLSPQVHFYVEIHGHENKDLAETVEVATVGLSVDQAQHIKDLFSESFKREGLPPLVIKVDLLEKIYFNATHNNKFGVLSFISPAIHIEFPRVARIDGHAKLVKALVSALPKLAKENFAKSLSP